MVLYAASRLGLSSSKGTSTVSLARVGLKVSTVLFTGGSPQSSQSSAIVGSRGFAFWNCAPEGTTRWSGRQDSNLRSPAPKAGALATTLRPGPVPPVGSAPVREPPGVYGNSRGDQ